MTPGRDWPFTEKHVQYAFPTVALGGLEAGLEAEAIRKRGGELALVAMAAVFRH